MAAVAHIPVVVQEVLQLFSPQPGDCLLDATVGHGGHAQAYLEATSPDGTVIGLDADEQALTVARQRLMKYGARVRLIHANFGELNDALKRGGMVEEGERSFHAMSPHHILFDLGLGSHQLSDSARGFSFTSSGPLRMAYGELKALPPAHVQALNALERHLGYLPDVSELLTGLSVRDFAHVIRFYGEERYAEAVAHALKRSLPITTSEELARVIAEAVPQGYEHGRIHPATRTFQALRLAVNRELETLEAALPEALALLPGSGVIAVISFHSLEDRIVKNFFRTHRDELEVLTKKPLRASEAEIKQNPRSRSAKLRAARKK